MKVSDSCFAVTGLGYSTPWCVNAGFVVGSHTTLIVDTGANSLAAGSILGYASAVRPTNLLRVINTEKHFDHIGGNSFFRERGIEIWGHVDLVRTEQEFAAEVREFNDGIANPARRAREEARAFFVGTKLALPDIEIKSERSLNLGELEVRILLTPGHTKTNLSVWVPTERVLFCGDCLISKYLPNLDAGGPEDWKVWLNSLDKLEGLHPAVIVAGHGPVVQAEHISQVVSEVRETLKQAIRRGHSPTATVNPMPTQTSEPS